MKKSLFFIFLLIISSACKNKSSSKENSSSTEKFKGEKIEQKDTIKTISEKIANANGLGHWKDVTEIQFTFNVDRENSHFERSWTWKPKSNEVTLVSLQDTITYNRSNIDSLAIKADQGFINDKYWLLAPFNLVWDKGTTITTQDTATAPISNKKLRKLTILYGNKGGYTPGDAYDFYYGNDYIIQEWVFRKKNTIKPSMMTTWEDYEDFQGIKIAKTHLNKDSSLKLFFSNIKIKKQ